MTKRSKFQIFKVAMYVIGILMAIIAIFYPTEFGIFAGEILLLAAAAAAIIFPIYFAITHPREAVYTFIGIVALGLIFLISYFIADGEVVMGLVQGQEVMVADESTSKLVGAGINTFLALVLIAVVGLIVTEVSSIF